MKYLMIFLAINLTTTALGQQVDTLIIDSENQRQWVIRNYYEDGSVRAIVYQSSRLQDDTTIIDGRRLVDMSAEDLFMRKINPQRLRLTDSTYTFFHNGKVDRKTFFRDGFTYDYIYDQHWKLSYVEKTHKERKEFLFLQDQSLVLSNLSTSLMGRIGEEVTGKFTFRNRSIQPLSLAFSASNDQIVLPAQLILPGGGSADLLLHWEVTKAEDAAALTVRVGGQHTFELSIDYDGYHLNETDFLPNWEEAPEFVFEDISTLMLRLSGSEKLLRIANVKGEEVAELSVPKILNVIPFGILPKGEYLLILVELGSKQEKYCRISYF